MFMSAPVNPSPEELDAIDKQLLLVSKWDYFVHLLIDRGAAPLFYIKLPLLRQSKIIPQNIKSMLAQAYYRTMSRNILLYKALGDIIDVLNNNQIRFVVLKGMHVAEHFYRDIALRQSSDIDLLVEESSGLDTLDVIKTLGFQNIKSEISEFVGGNNYKIHYSPLVREDVVVEVHHRLHKESADYALRVQDMITDAETLMLAGRKVRVFNVNDTLIHACVHADKHLREGYVQFTGYFDITNILAACGNTFSWEKFTARCRFHHCEQAAFRHIIIAGKYFCAAVPGQIKQLYSHTLSAGDEQLLLSLLSGNTADIQTGVYEYYAHQHYDNLKSLTSAKQKLRYLKDIIFPSKQFMVSKYCPQKPKRYRLYYFYRYYRGIRGLFYKN
jgi:hypothetical protein